MSAIDRIVEKLSRYPAAQYQQDKNHITISPSGAEGFEVSFHEHKKLYEVFFDGWHEVFNDEESALNCFAFGLSSECRLQVRCKGDFRYKWIMEALEPNGNWVPRGEVGYLLFPFWRKTRIIYLQNHLITAAS